MKSIGEHLKDKNIILEGADVFTGGGFTQVPNVILVSDKLSSGAKLTYAMLLKYAWQNDYCFPGRDKLSKEMGAGKRSIIRWVKELEENKFIEVKRQGLGKSNLYTLKVKALSEDDRRKKPKR